MGKEEGEWASESDIYIYIERDGKEDAVGAVGSVPR